MPNPSERPTAETIPKDKLLFTPGPLTTSMTVKQAMLRDLGSRDTEFMATVKAVREKLLAIAGVSKEAGYEAVLMQGSGTFGLESVISSTVPPRGKLLVVVNGAYGERLCQIADRHRIDAAVLKYAEHEPPEPADVDRRLADDSSIRQVAIVHCETTSGIMNPIEEIGQIVHQRGRRYMVDSMSAFGAVPFDMQACHIDFLVSSANKCLEGVPGFAFVICRREALLECEAFSRRTLALDVLDQWKGLEGNGQFRFTPPTHTILAFAQALQELDAEGGVPGRAKRYRENYVCLVEGMSQLGFTEYVPRDRQGYIITSFTYPNHPRFDFEQFYHRLSEKGYVIYPGKVSQAACFRIGNIGRLFKEDVLGLLEAVRESLHEMDIQLTSSH